MDFNYINIINICRRIRDDEMEKKILFGILLLVFSIGAIGGYIIPHLELITPVVNETEVNNTVEIDDEPNSSSDSSNRENTIQKENSVSKSNIQTCWRCLGDRVLQCSCAWDSNNKPCYICHDTLWITCYTCNGEGKLDTEEFRLQ